ncbi:MAG: OsmC family protein [Bacteroidales bacterium]
MPVHIDVRYQGDLRCSAVHGPSGSALATDAPADNQGLAQTFSPTDLVATAIGACMLTVMGIYARPRNIPLDNAHASVAKEMTKTPPRRIEQLTVTLHLPVSLDAKTRSALEQVAKACPVAASLHPDVKVAVVFEYA